jgi:hypothetical protein
MARAKAQGAKSADFWLPGQTDRTWLPVKYLHMRRCGPTRIFTVGGPRGASEIDLHTANILILLTSFRMERGLL